MNISKRFVSKVTEAMNADELSKFGFFKVQNVDQFDGIEKDAVQQLLAVFSDQNVFFNKVINADFTQFLCVNDQGVDVPTAEIKAVWDNILIGEINFDGALAYPLISVPKKDLTQSPSAE